MQRRRSASALEHRNSEPQKWMQKQQIHIKIIDSLIHNLNSWRSQKRSTYTPSNYTLQLALKEQNNIGWNHFIEGFWSKQFSLCQQQHFNTLNITKSTILLLSKTQWRIWQIAWQLWDHQNNILHGDNHTFHPEEIEQISKEIQHEWSTNLSTLPMSYKYLFKDSVQTILNKSHTHRLNWLINVWTIRDIQ